MILEYDSFTVNKNDYHYFALMHRDDISKRGVGSESLTLRFIYLDG